MPDRVKERVWRIGFGTPTGHTHTYKTKPITEDAQQLIAELMAKEPAGSKLILLQQLPPKTPPNRIRFCPFCGNAFEDYETDEYMTEAICMDCGAEIDMSMTTMSDGDDEGEGGDEDA